MQPPGGGPGEAPSGGCALAPRAPPGGCLPAEVRLAGGSMLPTCRLQCLGNDHLLPLPQKPLSLETKPFFHFENVADFYSFVCIAFALVGSMRSTESVQNQ